MHHAEDDDADPWATHDRESGAEGRRPASPTSDLVAYNTGGNDDGPPKGRAKENSTDSGVARMSYLFEEDEDVKIDPAAGSASSAEDKNIRSIRQPDVTEYGRRDSTAAQQMSSSPIIHPSSSTSALDPWSTPSARSHVHETAQNASKEVRGPEPISVLPTTSSTIRGGFASSGALALAPQGSRQPQTQSSRPASMASPQSRIDAAQPVSPTPWNGEEISVLLHPELEGIIFKHQSYTILRSPIDEGPASETEATTSTHVLVSTRSQRTHRRNRGEDLQSNVRLGLNGHAEVANSPSATGDRTATLSLSKSVVRRYSDFVWLNNILLRRYPFRLIPILPPKRLTIPIAGRHLSADDGFVERRRRALQRYLRALCAHPTLSCDPLVRTFLTDKRSISEWRTSNLKPSTEEEFLSSYATPPPQKSGSNIGSTSAMSIFSPTSSSSKEFDARLEAVAKTVPGMVEKWTNLVSLFERMSRRLEAQGLDHARLASLLDSLEATTGGLHRSTKPQIHHHQQQQQAVSLGLSNPEVQVFTSSSAAIATRVLVERVSETHRDLADLHSLRSTYWTDLTLEHLKRQRDLWLAFAQLLNRKNHLAADDVTLLKQKVSATKSKLAALSSTPLSSRTANHMTEVESLESSLRAESHQVDALMRRREGIKVCLSSELRWLALNADKPRGEGVWSQWVVRETQLASATRTAMIECANEMGDVSSDAAQR